MLKGCLTTKLIAFYIFQQKLQPENFRSMNYTAEKCKSSTILVFLPFGFSFGSRALFD